ncbi:MAG: hypothetical protein NVS4B13_02620 [Candidatus Elarobacter sp.]
MFVIDPYGPNGGTYMAYHVARIFQLDFGFTAVAVMDPVRNNIRADVFGYDSEFPQMSIEEMERSITDRDVLHANAGHSRFVFGPRLPGRKIMYVQGFTTARPLDCSFDAYVSVSSFVQQYLKTVYAVDAPTIAPFIEPQLLAPAIPWDDRPPDSAAVHLKGQVADLVALRLALARNGSDIRLEHVIPGGISRYRLSEYIGAARYLVNVSPAEGFGLVPLEAMAVGSVVLGFDGFGGREYLVDGVNCRCVAYGDFDGLAQRIIAAFEAPQLASRYRAAGLETAARYEYPRFRAAWCAQLDAFLNVTA